MSATVRTGGLSDDHVTAVVARYRSKVREVLEKDRRKIAVLDEVGDTNVLWSRVYERAGELLRQYDVHLPSVSRLKSAVMSVQSSTGNSSEVLFGELARTLLAEGLVTQSCGGCGAHLVGFRSDAEFVEAVRALRSLMRKSGREAADEKVPEIADRFFVTLDYVRSFLDSAKKSIVYPDTVSIFCDGLVLLAEHKLSGNNDVKAVRKNLEALDALRPWFEVAGRRVQTAIVMPFTDADPHRRIDKWRHEQPAPDHLAANRDAFSLVLGTEVSEEIYSQLLEEVACGAADRVFQYLAAGMAYGGAGVWTKTDITEGADTDLEHSLLEMAAS